MAIGPIDLWNPITDALSNDTVDTMSTVKLTIKTNPDTYQPIKSVEVALKLGSEKRQKECLRDQGVLLNDLECVFSDLGSEDVASEGSGGNGNVLLEKGKGDGMQGQSIPQSSAIMRKSSMCLMNRVR